MRMKNRKGEGRKHLVSWWNSRHERRTEKDKGGNALSRKIFGQRRRRRTEKERRKVFWEEKYLVRRRKRTEKEKEGNIRRRKKVHKFSSFFGWGDGVDGGGESGTFPLPSIWKCQFSWDMLWNSQWCFERLWCVSFFAVNSLRQFITPLCAKTEQDYQQKTFHFCFTFYKGYFERKMQ